MSDAMEDIVDRAAGLRPGMRAFATRQERGKVVAATQGSAEALFDPSLETTLSVPERLLLALYACELSESHSLAGFYRQRLLASHLPDGWPDLHPPLEPQAFTARRIGSLLDFTRRLTLAPVEGDREALLRLQASGLDSAAIVVVAQLLAFVAYQIRLSAGLAAMAEEPVGESVAVSAGQRESGGIVGETFDIQGFTNRTLGWRSWLQVLDLQCASAEQLAVLEESHPKAKVSEYYLTLIHQPRILQQRSLAFNAIMYAPGGLPRAERELASTVVSRINQCVYCASVHAQRYAQLAKRDEVIREVFADPGTAGGSAREKAIIQLSIALTRAPGRFSAEQLQNCRAAGLDDLQVLDLIHAVAIFAWANRLMLNLGEPVADESTAP